MTAPTSTASCSLGTSVDTDAHRNPVRQDGSSLSLNKSMPRTLGDGFVHVSKIDFGVEVDQPPYNYDRGEVGDVSGVSASSWRISSRTRRRCRWASAPFPAPSASAWTAGRTWRPHGDVHRRARRSRGARDCDLPAQGDRLRQGRHGLHDGLAAPLQSSSTTIRWSRCVRFDYTNDTAIIRRFRRMTAINSAIEVDLTRPGLRRLDRPPHVQRCRRPEWTHAWARPLPRRAGPSSPHFTAADGQFSRITASLKEGAESPLTRSHVRTVVTEYGVAESCSAELPRAAKRLIAIAHPTFRDERQPTQEVHEL